MPQKENWFQKKITLYKQKSLLGKLGDFFFYTLIALLIIPTTRAHILRLILATGIMQPKIVQEAAVVLPLQDFQWQFMQDGTIKSLDEYKEKVLFINFWATWCPPCVAELPSIESLVKRFQDNQEIKFILATSEEPAIVEAFLAKQKIDMPVAYYRATPPQSMSSRSIPTTVIIDKQRRLVTKKSGAANWDSKKIRTLLKDLSK